jgi:hypothetical protein
VNEDAQREIGIEGQPHCHLRLALSALSHFG